MKRAIVKLLLLPAVLGAALAPAGAQQSPASAGDLAAITQRGRALQAYDQAAWHGTDAGQVVAGADTSGLQYYIAQKTPSGWVVDFGKLDAAGTTFLTKIEAQSADGLTFTAQSFATPRSDTGFLVAAAHAIASAEASFKPVSGYKYNVAVLPVGDGNLFVYLYPAQTVANVYPVGGDERFTASPDGTKILDAHVMHHSILAIPNDAHVPPGATVTAQVRSVVVANVPQDTDVFHVLARKPAMPDYIIAQGQMYVIDVTGTIKYMGPAPAKP
jgi:hypothetical protein